MINESQLYRYFIDECSADEKREVERWLESDPQNRKKYHELKQIWEVELSEANSYDYDTEKSWKIFRRKYFSSSRQKSASSKSNVKRLRWMYYAAAAVLLIAVGFYSIENYYESVQQEEATAQHIITQKGERTKVILADSTKITLNSASQLTIPPDYMEETRTIHLDGEAYFEVEHNEELPFIVESGNRYAKDLGTKFNVNTYDKDVFEVAVEEGAVSLGKMKDRTLGSSKANLEAYQVGALTKSGEIDVRKVQNIDLFSGWTEGKLIFKKTPFVEVKDRLERHFGINFVIKGSSLKQRTLTASYDDIPLNELLNVLSLTMDIEYNRLEDSTIVFTKK